MSGDDRKDERSTTGRAKAYEDKTHWLVPERLRIYPKLILAVFIVTSLAWVWMSRDNVSADGKPLGTDFIAFWAASHVALNETAANAYELDSIHKAERIAVPASDHIFPWFYPPAFFLIVLPFALAPYLVAYLIFVSTTLWLYLRLVCREISVAGGFWWVAAFPATWINIAHGQNAFLTASLAAMGIVSIGRAPILAGVFVGLLSIKPQLGLFFPLALVAARQWKTICSAAITALLFNGLGIAVLGTDAFKAFLNHLSSARTFMEDGSLPWQKMPTLFASSRLIGFSVDASYLIHGIGLAYGAIVVWLVWSRTQRIELRGSALMVATFAGSPFCYDYDLAWLAFPIAWLVRCGLTDGWRRLEREALLLSWLAPLLIAPLAMAASIPLGPPVIAMLLWLTISRLDHAIRPRITPRP